MDNINQILILVLLIFLIILIIFALGFIFYLYKKIPRLEGKDTPSLKKDLSHCAIHPKQRSKGQCDICHILLCELCIKEFDKLNFCTQHLDLFTKNEWQELAMLKGTTDENLQTHSLYKLKKELWNVYSLPSVIITHYRIDLDSDQIETYFHFKVIQKDFQKVTDLQIYRQLIEMNKSGNNSLIAGH